MNEQEETESLDEWKRKEEMIALLREVYWDKEEKEDNVVD